MTHQQVKEQLNKLPEPYKSEALEAFEKWPIGEQIAERGDVEGEDLANAILRIDWGGSAQGYEYWRDIYRRTYSGEFDPPRRVIYVESCEGCPYCVNGECMKIWRTIYNPKSIHPDCPLETEK